MEFFVVSKSGSATVVTQSIVTTSGDIILKHTGSSNLTVNNISTLNNVTIEALSGTILEGGFSPSVDCNSLSLYSGGGIGTVTDFSGTTSDLSGNPFTVDILTLNKVVASGNVNIKNINVAGTDIVSNSIVTSIQCDIVFESPSITLLADNSISFANNEDLSLISSGIISLSNAGLSTGGNFRLRGLVDIVDSGASPRTIELSSNNLYFYSGGNDTVLNTDVAFIDAELIS